MLREEEDKHEGVLRGPAAVREEDKQGDTADYKAGDTKAGNYEKKKALEMGAGEGPSMYGSKSPMQMKGSWMSKHCSK